MIVDCQLDLLKAEPQHVVPADEPQAAGGEALVESQESLCPCYHLSTVRSSTIFPRGLFMNLVLTTSTGLATQVNSLRHHIL